MSGGHYEYMQWDPGINWKIINGLEEILKDR